MAGEGRKDRQVDGRQVVRRKDGEPLRQPGLFTARILESLDELRENLAWTGQAIGHDRPPEVCLPVCLLAFLPRGDPFRPIDAVLVEQRRDALRLEERRVGKECRSRWSP